MAVTQTTRLKLPQWSAGGDSPSRAGFNAAFAALDAKAAYDDGAIGGAALPTDDVVDGRYAATVEGSYRRLFRRAGGAWTQVGGNTWRETLFERAESAAPLDGIARQRLHPSLTNPTTVERWDGSSDRGGRQVIGDLNSGQPGALHVGDTTSAVDLATRGRIFARTTGAGQRGVVAQSGGNDHGALFSAREVGGSVPWLVDARGRMQAQAPAAFGSAALTDGVPVVAAPGTQDLAAADLYAAASKPALRLFRAVGDATPIATVAQDKITLGRSSWANGRVDVLGPGLYVEKDTTVAGALGVSGAATVGALTAASAQINGALTATGTTNLAALNVSGRLDLPTNQPSGNSAGQLRISDDWKVEVYDGSKWHGRFGSRSGRKHQWSEPSSSAAVNNGVEALCWGLKPAAGNGTLARFLTDGSGQLILDRAGLWFLSWEVFGDFGAGNLRCTASLKWPAGGFYLNPDSGTTPPGRQAISQSSYSTGGFAGSGGFCMRPTWMGYVPQSLVGTPILPYCYQTNSAGARVAFEYQLSAEWLSD